MHGVFFCSFFTQNEPPDEPPKPSLSVEAAEAVLKPQGGNCAVLP